MESWKYFIPEIQKTTDFQLVATRAKKSIKVLMFIT